jgi:hypothetical protein
MVYSISIGLRNLQRSIGQSARAETPAAAPEALEID